MAPKRRSGHLIPRVPSKRVKSEGLTLVSGEIDTKDLKNSLQSILQLVTNLRNDSNRILSKEFLRLPSRKLYPDYYEEIESPISLNEIKLKLNSNRYKDVAEFVDDFKLMYNNAVTYNGASSLIANDCKSLFLFVEDQTKLTRSKVEDYTPHLKQIIQLCINYKPYKRSKISAPFMDDVDGEQYPEYYKVIKKAMSFNKLLENLSSYGSNLPKFLKDINLIWQNAQTFNDEKSLIYQDSLKLSEYFYRKFEEFVELNNVNIKYEIPNVASKDGAEKADGDDENDAETVTVPKRKRGRPKLGSVPVESPTPIKLKEEDNENDSDDEDGDDSENSDSLNDSSDSDDARDEDGNLEPLSVSILKSKPDSNRYIGYKRFQPKRSSETFNNFIKSFTISSTRNLFKKTALQDSEVGKFVSSFEKTKPDAEKFFPPTLSETFQYVLSQDDLSSTDFSLDLRNLTTIEVDTILNMQKIGTQKFEQSFFFNGEKINATTSVYEYDVEDIDEKDKLSLSKYDLTLLPGLNSLEFVCKVGPIIQVDSNGKLPSRHATNPNNENNYVTERCRVWVTVDQF